MKKIKYVINRLYPKKMMRPMIKYIKNNLKQEDYKAIEIGSHRGENAYNILRNLNMHKLYFVDPYGDAKHYRKALSVLRPWKDIIEFVKKKSDEAVDNFANEEFDFIYIDGDHSYEAVKKDIELYYPKVMKGGVLGGHDFCGSCPGVCRAVIEFCDKNNIKFQSWDKDWWFIK